MTSIYQRANSLVEQLETTLSKHVTAVRKWLGPEPTILHTLLYTTWYFFLSLSVWVVCKCAFALYISVCVSACVCLYACVCVWGVSMFSCAHVRVCLNSYVFWIETISYEKLLQMHEVSDNPLFILFQKLLAYQNLPILSPYSLPQRSTSHVLFPSPQCLLVYFWSYIWLWARKSF